MISYLSSTLLIYAIVLIVHATGRPFAPAVSAIPAAVVSLSALPLFFGLAARAWRITIKSCVRLAALLAFYGGSFTLVAHGDATPASLGIAAVAAS